MSPSVLVGVLDPYSRKWECIVPASSLVSLILLIFSAQTVKFEDFEVQSLRIFAAMKLRHSELACHQQGLMQQLRDFWKEGNLCDVVLKSIDGIEHRVHRNVFVCCQCRFESFAVCPFPRSRTDTTRETCRDGSVWWRSHSFCGLHLCGEPDVATVECCGIAATGRCIWITLPG